MMDKFVPVDIKIELLLVKFDLFEVKFFLIPLKVKIFLSKPGLMIWK